MDSRRPIYTLRAVGRQLPNRGSIVSAIRSEKSYNPGGITANSIQFTPGLTPDGNPLNCLYIMSISNTAFSIPKTPICV